MMGTCLLLSVVVALCCHLLYAWKTTQWMRERSDEGVLLERMWQTLARHRQGLRACRQHAEQAQVLVEQALMALDTAEQTLPSARHSGTAGRQGEGGHDFCEPMLEHTELEQARDAIQSARRALQQVLDATAPCDDPD